MQSIARPKRKTARDYQREFREGNNGLYKKRSRALTDDEIANALRKHHGFQWLAAEELGVMPQTISAAIAKSPYLQQTYLDLNEKKLDEAEKTLRELILEEKNIAAVAFYLKCKGKRRGYIEVEQNTAPAQIIFIDSRNPQVKATAVQDTIDITPRKPLDGATDE